MGKFFENLENKNTKSYPLSLLFIAVVVLIGLIFSGWLIVSKRLASQDSSAAPGVAASTQAANGSAGCKIRDGLEPDKVAPGELIPVKMDRIGGVTFPHSDDFGPFKTADDGLRYCHSRNGSGAAMAASSIVSQASQYGSLSRGRMWSYYLADGPVKAEMLNQLRAAKEFDSPVDIDEGSPGEVIGYKIWHVDANTARVSIVFDKSGEMIQFSLDMVWQNNDWLVKPASTKMPIDTRRFLGANDFVFWRA